MDFSFFSSETEGKQSTENSLLFNSLLGQQIQILTTQIILSINCAQ